MSTAPKVTLPRRRATKPRTIGLTTLSDCGEDQCGEARGRGQPPKQWIRVHVAGLPDADLWFCSWRCVSYHAIGEELNFRDVPGERRGYIPQPCQEASDGDG